MGTNPNRRIYRHVSEVVEALREYKRKNKAGTSALIDISVDYLIEFFLKERGEYEKIDDITPHLGILLLRAMMLLEESDQGWVKEYRGEFEKFWGRDQIGCGIFAENYNPKGLALNRKFVRIMEEALPGCRADYTVVEGVWLVLTIYFNKFIEEVYIGKGMHEAVMSAKLKGVDGIFGQTNLLIWYSAGRLMFTFRRGNKSITFVKGSEEKSSLNTGIQSCSAELPDALTMINDVIKYYDPAKFTKDRSTSTV